jgi:hypothetical protein
MTVQELIDKLTELKTPLAEVGAMVDAGSGPFCTRLTLFETVDSPSVMYLVRRQDEPCSECSDLIYDDEEEAESWRDEDDPEVETVVVLAQSNTDDD